MTEQSKVNLTFAIQTVLVLMIIIALAPPLVWLVINWWAARLLP